jgi:hypothetical protein
MMLSSVSTIFVQWRKTAGVERMGRERCAWQGVANRFSQIVSATAM